MRTLGEAAIPFLNTIFGPELSAGIEESSALFRSWADIVGKNHFAAAAAHSKVREFEKNVILIEADHPGWIQLLQTKQRKFLSDFQRRFPDLEIAGISFMLSKDDRIDNVDVTDGMSSTDSILHTDGLDSNDEGALEAPADALEKITDGRLRESLLRLAKEVDERNRELGEDG